MSSIYYTIRLVSPHGRCRTSRPKTFKTEEAAKTWAEKQGIKSYQIENLKSPESQTKKIRIKAD